MTHLIDKDALVAEIEKNIMQYEVAFDNSSFANYEASLIAKGKYRKLKDILSFLDTLEVKEVDLEKEILNYIGDEASCKHGKWTWYECNKMIRYFFELGIKAKDIEYDESLVESLEVKEVDLDKETTHYLLYEHRSPLNEITHQVGLKAEMQYHKDIENAYKAGLKLGLKAQKGE